MFSTSYVLCNAQISWSFCPALSHCLAKLLNVWLQQVVSASTRLYSIIFSRSMFAGSTFKNWSSACAIQKAKKNIQFWKSADICQLAHSHWSINKDTFSSPVVSPSDGAGNINRFKSKQPYFCTWKLKLTTAVVPSLSPPKCCLLNKHAQGSSKVFWILQLWVEVTSALRWKTITQPDHNMTLWTRGKAMK